MRRSNIARAIALLTLLLAGTARAGEPKPGEVREVEIAPGVNMKFCWVPPGTVQLGAPDEEQDYVSARYLDWARPDWMTTESARYCAKFESKGFWLAKYPVTQREWQAVMGRQSSWFSREGGGKDKTPGADTARLPVEQVSWSDGVAFLTKINERGAAEKVFGRNGKFALPHENEWEYACRGGNGNATPFYFGAALTGKQANCDTRRFPPYGLEGLRYLTALACLKSGMLPGTNESAELPLPNWLEEFRQNLEESRFYIRINGESLERSRLQGYGDDAPRVKITPMPGATLRAVMTEVLGKLELTYLVHADHIEILRKVDVGKLADRSPLYVSGSSPSEKYKKAVERLKAAMDPGIEQTTEYPLPYWLNEFSERLDGTGIAIRVNDESLKRHPAVIASGDYAPRIKIRAMPGATLEAVMVEVLWKQGLTFCVNADHIEILKKADADKKPRPNLSAKPADQSRVAIGRPTEVGAYEKAATHPWGLCDMHGNVWQWCDNGYGGEKKLRVLRGGSWNSSAADCRAAHRAGAEPERRANDIGLRVCFRPE